MSKDGATTDGPKLEVDHPDDLRGVTARLGGAELVQATFTAKTAELAWQDDYNATAGTVVFSGVSRSHPDDRQVRGTLTLPAGADGLTGEVAYSALLDNVADDTEAQARTKVPGDSEVSWAAVASALAASLSALTSLLTAIYTHRRPLRTKVLRLSKRAKNLKLETERPELKADHTPLDDLDLKFIELTERLLKMSDEERASAAGSELFNELDRNRHARSGQRQEEVARAQQDADDDLSEIEETWL